MTQSENYYSWSGDYIDLRSHFLTEDQANYLLENSSQYQKFVATGCPTCEGTQKYVWEGEERDCDCRSQLQLYKHYANANIGLTYQRLSWGDYEGDPDGLRVAEQYLQFHKSMVRSGVGIMYHGGKDPNFGTGKTMLLCLVSKEMVRLGYSVYFATFTQMIEEFTKGWANDASRARFEKMIIESDVFVLDDIGKELKTKLSESTFDYILRERVQNSKPTLLTTNMTIGELEQGYGKAIFSLLKERAVCHEVMGGDYRPKARQRTLEEALSSQVRPIQ